MEFQNALFIDRSRQFHLLKMPQRGQIVQDFLFGA
jgi:hypothetical protein